MTESLTHWYDGWFYDIFIAPNQDKAFYKIKEIISDGSSILDVGCGTGRLCFQLNDKCSKIDGVDASKRNIEIANKKQNDKTRKKINFFHNDINFFLKENDFKYNYAVLSYVIHEIDEAKRENLLELLFMRVEKIIIIDYLVPHPKSITGIINRGVEFIAGKNHYRNFKSYLKNYGLKNLAKKLNFKFIIDIKDTPTTHIAVLIKN
jgi:SAM-dependent methyltransferase